VNLLRRLWAAIFQPRYVLGDDGRARRVYAWTRVADWGELAGRMRRRLRGKDPLRLVARWTLEIEDIVTGRRRVVELGENLIVNSGLNALKDRMFNPATAQAAMTWIGIGTGATGEAPTDVALQTEARREQGAYAAGGVGVCTVSKTFAADGTARTYAEAGLFDLAAAGVMFNRKTFPGVPIGIAENVTVSCTLTAANG
jgi:hypothetical protein